MTVASTLVSLMSEVKVFAEVRCRACKRLLFRWRFTGLADIEAKCPRCGTIDLIRLSTG